MLHDVILHLANEQPLLADLLNEPAADDVCAICTNLRTMGGKAPVFVDNGKSTFVFPLAHIRFIEIRPGTVSDAEPAAPPREESEPTGNARGLQGRHGAKPQSPESADDEYPMSPLQRLAWVSRAAEAPPAEPSDSPAPEPRDGPAGDEEDLIRRIREI